MRIKPLRGGERDGRIGERQRKRDKSGEDDLEAERVNALLRADS